MTASEFSRTVRIDTLGESPRTIEIAADPSERAALAGRFGLEAVEALSASVALTRSGEEIRASGRLEAQVVQSCVATGQPLPAAVAQDFQILFRPQPAGGRADEEIELGEGEMDVVFYDAAAIDIGDAVAETLSLSLDPYPRSPDADEVLRKAGVKDEEEARAQSSPFAALKATRDKPESR